MNEKPRMPVYGYTCANNGHISNSCDAEFDGEPGESQSEVEKRASKAGWCIGHHDGQGHIVCPECKDTIWDARPLHYSPGNQG